MVEYDDCWKEATLKRVERGGFWSEIIELSGRRRCREEVLQKQFERENKIWRRKKEKRRRRSYYSYGPAEAEEEEEAGCVVFRRFFFVVCPPGVFSSFSFFSFSHCVGGFL
ncbi:hypothetical protein LINPERPRIM_LOCUS39374 [Linum perenne]